VTQPLEGIRVVEIGDGVAVACAGKQFADFGADVVKVERPGGGEVRRLPPFPNDRPHRDRGGFHLSLDTGKRSLALDLGTPSGREVLGRLAAGAHLALIELPPTLAERVLATVRGAIDAPSTVALSPHGLDGPYRDRRENDLSIFAWSTRMHRHRLEEEPPLRYAPQVVAMQVGLTAAASGIGAAWGHLHDGVRRDAEVSAVEALAGNVDTSFVAWSLAGGAPSVPRRSRGTYPVGTYGCKDGFVQLTAGDSPFFERACRAIGRPDFIDDARFRTRESRPANHEEFLAVFQPWLDERTREEVFRAMQAERVLCTPILDVSEALRDAQSVARGSYVEVEQPDVGAMTLPGPPFRLGGVGSEAWRAGPAPRLGEHGCEILDALGYARDEQQALFRAGVTG
jgi:crotonobetainyl-CoA:carnitine CoA-transferase CaiB-like acyl-CoA transferase